MEPGLGIDQTGRRFSSTTQWLSGLMWVSGPPGRPSAAPPVRLGDVARASDDGDVAGLTASRRGGPPVGGPRDGGEFHSTPPWRLRGSEPSARLVLGGRRMEGGRVMCDVWMGSYVSY